MTSIASILVTLVTFLVIHLQPSSAVVITSGVPGRLINGSFPVRLEMTAFEKSGPAFDLFVLAFRAFQQTDQSNIRSYYQVAGKTFSSSLDGG